MVEYGSWWWVYNNNVDFCQTIQISRFDDQMTVET